MPLGVAHLVVVVPNGLVILERHLHIVFRAWSDGSTGLAEPSHRAGALRRAVVPLAAPQDVERRVLNFGDRASEFVVDDPRDGVVLLVGPLTTIRPCHRDESCRVKGALKHVVENQRWLESGVVTNRLQGAIDVVQSPHPRRAAHLGQPLREGLRPPRDNLCPYQGEAATRCEEVRHTIHCNVWSHPVPGIESCNQLHAAQSRTVLKTTDEDRSPIAELCSSHRSHLG
jgi:hypothetical protein